MVENVLRTVALFSVLMSISSPAYAYLDPATGSIIVQTLLAAVAGWAVYAKRLRARALELFSRLVRRSGKSGPE